MGKDMGSCGNACCIVDYDIQGDVNRSYHLYMYAIGFLKQGGKDGSFSYTTGPDKAGHNPGDDLTKYPIEWDYIFQGTHTTTGGYVDTLNFNIGRAPGGMLRDPSVTMRISSVSNIHGALGDNGQNFKNIATFLEGSFGGRFVHGCGQKPGQASFVV